ncbi:hypothetical protein CHISP_2837 [Chitinispirillum alkaliphilum]|nr:hypothetical protein CHISP_2837 [Chitinispirillum alkaliphilum]
MSTFLALQALENLEREFNVVIVPSKITGNRWSFAPGCKKSFQVPITSSQKIRVDEVTGYIVYGWNVLSEEQKRLLGESLRGIDEY